ncbi:MAG: aldo/keto reductase [Kiritimatiellae bacterium]|nr:aldo/keto reductase [Kiritimatiellia bacterium]MDW8458698.1 aldo/keto reductase [Verrucomicrobiota bacterium]
MRYRPLAHTSVPVSVVGYGAMALSLECVPEPEALDTLHRVFNLGVTLIDTAYSYCDDERDQHHNERLVAKALQTWDGPRDCVLVATKGGAIRINGRWQRNGRPEHLYDVIRASHEALGGDRPIPIWQHHWPDPRVPIRDSMAAARKAVDEGYVRFVGVSNYSVEQLEEARSVVPIVSVQNQYNLWCRDPEHDGVLTYCERHNICFLPYRPVGGLGLAQQLPRTWRLAEIAASKGVSVYRLMIAWLIARSPAILPIPGSSRWAHAEDSLRGYEMALSAEEIEAIGSISLDELPGLVADPRPVVPPAGDAFGGSGGPEKP